MHSQRKRFPFNHKRRSHLQCVTIAAYHLKHVMLFIDKASLCCSIGSFGMVKLKIRREVEERLRKHLLLWGPVACLLGGQPWHQILQDLTDYC
jgi:hypothetical protein